MAHKSNDADAQTDRVTSTGQILQYGILTVIGVNLVNIGVLFLGLSIVDYPAQYVGGQFGPLAIVPVVANSTIAAVAATTVYGLLTRYSRHPNRTFTIIAVVVFVLSFAMFLSPDMAGAPIEVFVTLGVMHITAAAVIVGILTRIPHRNAGLDSGE